MDMHEYFSKTNHIVEFLKNTHGLAPIVIQGEGNTDQLIEMLEEVKPMIDNWIEELKTLKKG